MNLELFGVAVDPPSMALSPMVAQHPLDDAWLGYATEKGIDRLIDEALLRVEVPRVVEAASGVWDVLMKDARRRVYEKKVPTDPRPALALEENAADNDAQQDQPVGSFETLLCRIEETDAPELVMCKLMGNLLWNDLRAIVKRRNFVEDSGPDLFGFEDCDQDELRVYDAMQWIYAFQDARPDEEIDGVTVVDVMVPFEFVCERLGWNAEWIRRVAARCLHQHFKGLLRTIEAFGDEGFLLKCERKLEDYVDVTGWRNQ
ncbi:hypothetical protein [Pandoraea terrigena]|uniref:Uncharacterized protein n=1 Tax=Pandoraea terrigena TaxID=2508292 RepID=A0A5E4XBN3_9BURK|nr:hypothetical protein [Pandoraea terrigena]VVE33717.1 hypothetical protein PTE31013_03809 [Pandoraea terrigena]